MKAYKLFRVLKSGEITPLFINKTKRLPIGEWMPAEAHRTKGLLIDLDGIAQTNQKHHT